MVELTPTIRSLPTNCLGVFDNFVKLSLKGLNTVHLWATWFISQINPKVKILFDATKELRKQSLHFYFELLSHEKRVKIKNVVKAKWKNNGYEILILQNSILYKSSAVYLKSYLISVCRQENSLTVP